MSGAVFMIILLSLCFSPWVACQNLQECQESCAKKIPDFALCNQTCLSLSLQNISSAVVTNGSGLVLAVPDPPRLWNSTYSRFTLEWNDYATEELNATMPVSYLLEVTRHQNTTNPTTILPFIEKYHLVEQCPFTIPDTFVTKTFFSFRLAVITFYGTSNFSAPSPLYTTNNSCEKEGEISSFYPCAVTNLYLEYHVAPLQYKRPNISSIVHWDFNRADLQNVKPKEQYLYIDMSMPTSFQVPQRCHQVGLLTNDFLHLNVTGQNKSSGAIASEDPMYFGCPYTVSFQLLVSDEDGKLWEFSSDAKFHIPFCFQGFCGCEAPDIVHEDSEFIHIEISSGNVTNITAANVTWNMRAWSIEVSYFRIVVTCLTHLCDQTPDVRYIDSIRGKTSYSETYHHLKTGKKQRVIVYAFDKDGCQHRPQRIQFDAVVPTTVAITTGTPSSTPAIVPRNTSTATAVVPTTVAITTGTPSSTPAIIPRHTSTATVSEFTTLTPTVESVKPGMSSATVAAITVPLVLLVLIALAMLLVCCRRFTSKPQSLHRAPTGLQRLTSHLDDNVYHRNIARHDSSIAYANEWDRSRLVVNLPTKSEGGLELNPAYVEQRIHDAMEAGEIDEFEIGYHRLELKRVLGKGAFGKVFLAEAYGIGGGSDISLVAVKVLNEKAHEDEMEDFKMEIEFMKTLGRHDNVVTMLGCCTLYPPMCLVVEYVPHGDLLHYLRDLRKMFEKHFNRCPLKDEAEKSSTPNTLRSSAENSPQRHLVPSASDTALSVKIASCDKPRPKKAPLFPLKFTAARRPLRQCLSETKTVTNNNWIKKSGATTETGTNPKVKRSLSATSLKTLKAASAMLAARRASENPTVHYVDRNPADMSNVTEVTLVPESPSVIKAQSLDGALDSSDLQSFAFQIANGMAYLSARGVVHRDLAARNILVGDDKVLKISDFGLSREGVYVKRSTGKIPLRWLSIEAMRDRIYSTASDIWAFGIVLWEICTLGGFPYPTLNDRDLLTFLMDGKRMNKPENCSDEIYQLMLACWSHECDDRPSFQSLQDQLENMQKLDQPYVNVDPNQEFHLPPTAGQDTAGNLMSFSDGAHSNIALTTDDGEDISLAHLHRHEQSDVESGQFSTSNHLSRSRDIQNPCYQSSNPESGQTFTSSPAAENDKNLCFSPEEASFLSNKKTGESLV